MISTTPKEYRFCRACFRQRPLDNFRRRSRTSDRRLSDCRTCHAAAERRRRTGQRSARDHAAMQGALAELSRARSAERVELICKLMFREFRGAAGFAQAWHEFIQTALPKGGRAGYLALESVQRLMIYREERQRSRPAPSDLSDAELEHEMQSLLQRYIKENSQRAATPQHPPAPAGQFPRS